MVLGAAVAAAAIDGKELGMGSNFYPPTQETTALAVEECITPDRKPFSNGFTMLRRISLPGG